MTFPEAETYLNTLPRFARKGAAAYVPGLERISAVLEAMGHPQKAYPIVHVAGTNGKGSTASFLAAITTAAGKITGLHTSPHLRHVAERMRVNGEPAPEPWIAEAVGQYLPVFNDAKVSYFEATVALSLLYFAHRAVEFAVVEVGLGGRFDATNIVSPEMAIITSISLDHTDILGNSMRDIAREKAGIIKSGVPVLSAVTAPDAREEIEAIAVAHQAPLIELDEEINLLITTGQKDQTNLNVTTSRRQYTSLEIGLPGAHQYRNALLALLAAEMLFSDTDEIEKYIAAGLARVKTLSGLRGRMEVVCEEPLIILDVGHNHEGLHAALTSTSEMLVKTQGRLFVMFGTMRDKDVIKMATQLSNAGARVLVPPIYNERALPPEELIQVLRDHNVNALCVPDVGNGLSRFHEEASPGDGLLIVGSHFLVAQYLELIAA